MGGGVFYKKAICVRSFLKDFFFFILHFRLAYVERETKRYNDSLQNEIQKSQELAATNILYEEQLRMARYDLAIIAKFRLF